MSTEKFLNGFAKRVLYLRNERKLSQEKFAFLCDIDRTYVGRIENLNRVPSIEIAYKIANGLGITVSELFDFEIEK
ncbi:helix-turn-helix transcriptional regulator [bacterium]|nr:helix-turn-helix transcriptional regulator [bacterium]